MTRYFITAREAVGLVLTSGLLFGNGLFTLEMGEPVSISDIAFNMCPSQNAEWIGAGPGEKSEEEILGIDETRVSTRHPAIFQLVPKHKLNPRWVVMTLADVEFNPTRILEATRLW
jgi:FlaA1/EpsC-like NDP-sugar epimerase